MARITGIGGVFLRSKDPKALAKWYSEHLGMTLNDFGGALFPWSDEGPAGTGMTTWSAFPADTKYFGDGPQAAMINTASTTSTLCSPSLLPPASGSIPSAR